MAIGAGVNVDPETTAERREFNREYCRQMVLRDTADPIDFFNLAGGYTLLNQV